MREKTTYIAYDGKEFDSSTECKEYEDRISNEILLAFDKNGKRIEVTSKCYNFLDYVYYIIFKSKEALNYFNEISEHYNYHTVDNDNNTYPLAVCYVNKDGWIPIFEEIKNMKTRIELLEKISNM